MLISFLPTSDNKFLLVFKKIVGYSKKLVNFKKMLKICKKILALNTLSVVKINPVL